MLKSWKRGRSRFLARILSARVSSPPFPPLIAHHPKKGPTQQGQLARGSGAVSGFVDILVEMHALSRRPDDLRRLLRSFSRHAATPPSLVIEWAADGTDYRSLGPSAELDYEHGWPVLHAILDQSEGPLTRRTILRRWRELAAAPARLTLWKWQGRAVREGRVLQAGRGTRREPFRYQLPGMAEKWQQRFRASFLKRPEQGETGKGREGLGSPPSEANNATPALPQVRPGGSAAASRSGAAAGEGARNGLLGVGSS
jgi:hypothetical protein